jgi:hypothetical protein
VTAGSFKILNETRPRRLWQSIQYGSGFHEYDATGVMVKEDTRSDRCLERRRHGATDESDELRSVRYEFMVN